MWVHNIVSAIIVYNLFLLTSHFSCSFLFSFTAVTLVRMCLAKKKKIYSVETDWPLTLMISLTCDVLHCINKCEQSSVTKVSKFCCCCWSCQRCERCAVSLCYTKNSGAIKVIKYKESVLHITLSLSAILIILSAPHLGSVFCGQAVQSHPTSVWTGRVSFLPEGKSGNSSSRALP